MRQEYQSECDVIEESSTYTAEAHHIIAGRKKKWYTILQLIPAITSALMGTLVVGQIVPAWVGVAALVAAIVTAIGTVMNPQQGHYEHLGAAKAFTAMKHEARAVREVFGPAASEAESAALIRCLHGKYEQLITLTPATDEKSFEAARKRIQGGVHAREKK